MIIFENSVVCSHAVTNEKMVSILGSFSAVLHEIFNVNQSCAISYMQDIALSFTSWSISAALSRWRVQE